MKTQPVEKPFPPIWCFIAVDRSDQSRQNERVAAALVGCPGLIEEDLSSALMLYETIAIPFNAPMAAAKLIALKIRECYIDAENYDWLIDAWNAEVNSVWMSRPDRRGSLPSLRSRERDKDPSLRQLNVMTGLQYYTADHIEKNAALKFALTNWGRSAVADAFAGACEAAIEQAAIVTENILHDRNDAAKPDMWLGMERVAR